MMLQRVRNFFCGRVSRAFLLILMPLIFAAYFGTLIFAIRELPNAFDWRYKSISKLLYVQTAPELPALHWIVSIAVVTAGLLMIPFAGYTGGRFRSISPIMARVGAGAFGGGAVLLILAAVFVSQPNGGGTHSPHNVLARLCGVALGVGMLAFYLCAARRWIGRNGEDHRLFFLWSLIVPPAVVIAAARGFAARVSGSSGLIYHVIQNRSLWHLGFWEWIGSAAVFLFLLSVALFLPTSAHEPSTRSRNGLSSQDTVFSADAG